MVSQRWYEFVHLSELTEERVRGCEFVFVLVPFSGASCGEVRIWVALELSDFPEGRAGVFGHIFCVFLSASRRGVLHKGVLPP